MGAEHPGSLLFYKTELVDKVIIDLQTYCFAKTEDKKIISNLQNCTAWKIFGNTFMLYILFATRSVQLILLIK